MTNVTITVTSATPRVTKIARGTTFYGDNGDYVLYIDPNNGKHYAALVNIRTGEGIHKAKQVANATYVTADELATLNFKNSDPVVSY
jgi:hypothetical protein